MIGSRANDSLKVDDCKVIENESFSLGPFVEQLQLVPTSNVSLMTRLQLKVLEKLVCLISKTGSDASEFFF